MRKLPLRAGHSSEGDEFEPKSWPISWLITPLRGYELAELETQRVLESKDNLCPGEEHLRMEARRVALTSELRPLHQATRSINWIHSTRRQFTPTIHPEARRSLVGREGGIIGREET